MSKVREKVTPAGEFPKWTVEHDGIGDRQRVADPVRGIFLSFELAPRIYWIVLSMFTVAAEGKPRLGNGVLTEYGLN